MLQAAAARTVKAAAAGKVKAVAAAAKRMVMAVVIECWLLLQGPIPNSAVVETVAITVGTATGH